MFCFLLLSVTIGCPKHVITDSPCFINFDSPMEDRNDNI